MASDKTNGNQRQCSNCGELAQVDRALTLQQQGRVIAVLCEGCQQARKIQVTIYRATPTAPWQFLQFFPLEA